MPHKLGLTVVAEGVENELRKPRANARGLFILVEVSNSEMAIVIEDAGGTSKIFWNHLSLVDLATEPWWVMWVSSVQPIELFHDFKWDFFHRTALTTDITHVLVVRSSAVILPSRTEGFQEPALLLFLADVLLLLTQSVQSPLVSTFSHLDRSHIGW